MGGHDRWRGGSVVELHLHTVKNLYLFTAEAPPAGLQVHRDFLPKPRQRVFLPAAKRYSSHFRFSPRVFLRERTLPGRDGSPRVAPPPAAEAANWPKKKRATPFGTSDLRCQGRGFARSFNRLIYHPSLLGWRVFLWSALVA